MPRLSGWSLGSCEFEQCEDDQIHLEALNERGQFVLGKNRNVGIVERTG